MWAKCALWLLGSCRLLGTLGILGAGLYLGAVLALGNSGALFWTLGWCQRDLGVLWLTVGFSAQRGIWAECLMPSGVVPMLFVFVFLSAMLPVSRS